MNDWNSLEKQLSSWTPRPPSARLAERIFGHKEQASERTVAAWFGPAFAAVSALILVLSGLTNRTGVAESSSLASIGVMEEGEAYVSNSLQAALTPGAYELTRRNPNIGWNLWSKATFEWTNFNHSHSSIHSFPSVQTNRSML